MIYLIDHNILSKHTYARAYVWNMDSLVRIFLITYVRTYVRTHSCEQTITFHLFLSKNGYVRTYLYEHVRRNVR